MERIPSDLSSDAQLPSWMRKALIGFEIDSKLARRGLQVSVALHIFGVGIILPNDLPSHPQGHASSKV